jgi:hypothetical protein
VIIDRFALRGLLPHLHSFAVTTFFGPSPDGPWNDAWVCAMEPNGPGKSSVGDWRVLLAGVREKDAPMIVKG